MQHLISCRSISGREIKRDDNVRTLVIENTMVVVFTRTEYRIVQLLLDYPILPDKKLNESLFKTTTVDYHMRKNLEKHIENIKGKIRHTRLSIRRVRLYGYLLVAEDDITPPIAASW